MEEVNKILGLMFGRMMFAFGARLHRFSRALNYSLKDEIDLLKSIVHALWRMCATLPRTCRYSELCSPKAGAAVLICKTVIFSHAISEILIPLEAIVCSGRARVDGMRTIEADYNGDVRKGRQMS